MDHNIGYKYRGGGEEFFERDLEALERNYFWAPNHIDLNDPCETLVLDEALKSQVDNLESLSVVDKRSIEHLHAAFDNLMNRREKMGMYSLSVSYRHELLWAHYADSHKGFCIEYDLKELIKNNIYQELHFFPVVYKDEPPNISIADIGKNERIIEKLLGTKSALWKYEKEIRIVTDRIGDNDYDYSAVTGIYFGCRMPEKRREKMMCQLRGRGIKYFQIVLQDKSYQFVARPVEDKYKEARPYLFQVFEENNKSKYSFIKKEYDQWAQKGTVDIKLEKKVPERQLKKIALDIKDKMFRKSKRVFMSYFLPEKINGDAVWAITHFNEGNYDVRILGSTIEQEAELKKWFKDDTRNVIGRWMDYSQYSGGGRTLYTEGDGIYLETRYYDGSSSNREKVSSEIQGGVRYDDLNGNDHGEYFVVDESDCLRYFSLRGEFMKLRPYTPL